MLASLTTPQIDTFRILGLRSNLASVEVLSCALASPLDPIRKAALETLVARGGPHEMAAILERIDHCGDAEVSSLLPHIPLLIVPIEAGLAGREPEEIQRSLCAIAKLRIATQFHHLVRVAQSPDDPQQIVAAQLLLSLACSLGAQAKQGHGKVIPDREQLLLDLSRSMDEYPEHRINQIFEIWLCASHWEDEPFKAMFRSDRRDTVAKMVIRQLKHSHRSEVLELTAGILWSKKPSIEALELLGDRREPALVFKFAELVQRLGITPQLRKNLSYKIPIVALEQIDFSSDSIPIDQRGRLLQLVAETEVSPDRIIHAINQLLETKAPEIEQVCSNAIRNLQSLKPEIIVMVLSDCFEVPDLDPYEPPPWKAELRAALERLLELYPLQSNNIKNSIESVLADFQCENMFKHIEDWPEAHLAAYGKLVRIADKSFIHFFQREASSQSSTKRIRALKIARFFGIDDQVREIITECIHDKNEQVRIEAMYTIANADDRTIAIEIIRPLIRDDDLDVKSTAISLLARLEGSLA